MRARFFIYFCWGVIVGVWLASLNFGEFGGSTTLSGLLLGAVLVIAWVAWQYNLFKQWQIFEVIPKYLVWLGILAMGSSLACGYIFGQLLFAKQDSQRNPFITFYGQNINFTGVVDNFVPQGLSKQQIYIQPKGFSQKLLVSSFNESGLSYGDVVEVSGTVSEIENFSGFDYSAYLRLNNVIAKIKSPNIIRLGNLKHKTLKFWLYQFKTRSIEVLAKNLSPDSAALAAGMLFGEKNYISDPFFEIYKNAGVTHVVAVSGYNLSVLLAMILLAGRFLQRKVLLIASCAIMVAFAIMTGFGASVARALLMAIILIVAQFSGRVYLPYRALIISAAIMIALKPMSLMWDLGFQLSFLATLGVLTSTSIIRILRIESSFLEAALFNFAAAIFSAPLVAYNFQNFSPIGILANAVLLPIVPVIMLLSALTALPKIGFVAALPAEFTLKLFNITAQFFSTLPGAGIKVQLSSLENALLISSLVIIAGVIWLISKFGKLG